MLKQEFSSRLALFRHRPYRLFAISGLAATFGNGLVYIALAWEGWLRAGTIAALAQLMACLWLPAVVLGPFFGACADRYDRKTLLLVSNAVRGGALIVFALAGLAGAAPSILVLALTLGVFQAFYFPAALPMIRDMFAESKRLEANATVDMLYELGTIAGMAASGFVIVRAGGDMAVLIAGLCFVGAAGGCAALPALERVPHSAPWAPWRDYRAALLYLAREPGLGTLYLVQSAVMVLMMTVPVLLVPFASRELSVTAREFSWLEALYSFGICLGGLASPLLCRLTSARRTLFALIALLALTLPAFALTRELVAAYALYTLVGIGMASWAVSLTLVQNLTASNYQGRLQSTSLSAAGLGVLAIYALMQGIGDEVSVVWIYGLECLLAMAAASLLLRRPHTGNSGVSGPRRQD